MTDNRIRLEPWEIDFCRENDLSLTDYARGKAAMARQKAEHETWLQTPAGVEYMAQKEAEREEKEAELEKYKNDWRTRK